jgi:hypothetical protein
LQNLHASLYLLDTYIQYTNKSLNHHPQSNSEAPDKEEDEEDEGAVRLIGDGYNKKKKKKIQTNKSTKIKTQHKPKNKPHSLSQFYIDTPLFYSINPT